MNTGARIKEIRKRKGITQKELSEKLGTSQQNLAQYENNKRNPKQETIKKIADALSVDITELYPEAQRVSVINQQVIHNLESLLEQLPQMDLSDEIKEDKRKTILQEIEMRKERGKEIQLLNLLEPDQKIILSKFSILNEHGKQKAIEHMELLEKIPEYRKDI